MRQNCAVFKFLSVGLMCLTYSFGGFANQTPDLAKKLLGAVANNDLGAVQQIIGEGADPRSNNENGISAIDMAVDKGFFDIAHLLLAAQKQNTRGLSKPSKISAEKQSLDQPDGPSVIDTISDFFKTNVSNASIVKAEPKPVLVEKKKITNTPDIESNPFTKLTDAILDFLPDGLQDEVETIHNVKPKVLIGSKTGSDEKVIYPVADLTEAESPYKIDKVVQVKELPRALESVKSITEPVVNVQPVAVAPLPNVKPRNLSQNLLTAQKQNTRGLSKPSKISAEKQSLDQPDGPSVIDTISDFFKTNVSNASIVKAEPKPVLVEKKKITNTPDIESNPFTKLTDAILDFLPDGLQDEVETIHNVKPKVLIGSKTGSDEKVIYPVADLTEAESPYKIDKVVQVKELPRALESVKSITEPVVNVQPVAVAPLPNVKPRNLSQNLLTAQKQNTRGLSKPSKISAEKQSLDQPDGPSVIDTISDFFKTNVSNASIVKAEPKPVLVEKKKITNTPDIESNPFTKLTDAILDFLPDGLQDEVETIHNVKPKVLIGSKTGSDEKVIYPVADLTEAESPYKIDKVVQVKELPRALESVKSITEPVVNVQPVAVAQLPNIKPRNLTQNDLVFGGRGRLDTVFEKVGNRADSCVIKASQKSVFCIESFNWPSEIQNGFETFGGVSGSGQSIVHYLNGKSVQYHGRFPNQSFNPIASYIMSKFGAPTEAPKTTTAMLGAASQPNRVYRWVTATTDDQPPVILEMREIDDLRWSLPPDRLNGLIRMYRKGEASIFKILTAADLLLLQIIKGGQQKALSSKGP